MPEPRGEPRLPPSATRPAPSPSRGRAASSTGRSAAEKLAREIVRERAGGVCEGCGHAQASNWSHRIGQGVGGLWAPSNGLHLCGSGTVGCHGFIGDEPTLARDERGWRLESHENPAEVPALHWLHGWVLLDDDGGLEVVGAEVAGAALARIFHVDKPL